MSEDLDALWDSAGDDDLDSLWDSASAADPGSMAGLNIPKRYFGLPPALAEGAIDLASGVPRGLIELGLLTGDLAAPAGNALGNMAVQATTGKPSTVPDITPSQAVIGGLRKIGLMPEEPDDAVGSILHQAGRYGAQGFGIGKLAQKYAPRVASPLAKKALGWLGASPTTDAMVNALAGASGQAVRETGAPEGLALTAELASPLAAQQTVRRSQQLARALWPSTDFVALQDLERITGLSRAAIAKKLGGDLGGLNQFKTTAELLDSPKGMALLEEVSPDARLKLIELEQARRAARKDALEAAAPGEADELATSAALREEAKAAEAPWKGEGGITDQAWKDIGSPAVVINAADKQAVEKLDDFIKDIPTHDTKAQNTYDKFMKLAKTSEPSKPKGDQAYLGAKPKPAQGVSFQDAYEVRRAAGELSSSPDASTAAFGSRLKGIMDDIFKRELKGDAAKKYKNAIELTKEKGDRFGKGIGGRVLGTKKYGEEVLPTEKIVRTLWGGASTLVSDDTIKRLKKIATKGEGLQGLKRVVKRGIQDAMTSSGASTARNLRRNKKKAMQELFDGDHAKDVDTVLGDFIDSTAFKRAAKEFRGGLKKEPKSWEALLQFATLGNAGSLRYPIVVGGIRRGARAVSGKLREKHAEVLAEMLMNPEYAKKLAMNAKPAVVKDLLRSFKSTAAQLGVLEAVNWSDEAEKKMFEAIDKMVIVEEAQAQQPPTKLHADGSASIGGRKVIMSEPTPKPTPDTITPYIPDVPKGTTPKGIDFKRLVKAMIKQESNYKLKAKSHKGARGLMQVTPIAAKEVSNKTGWDLKDFDPDDAESNIKWGSKYLELQFGRFKDLDRALAAYNAGPTAVSKYGGIPPFKETKDYVKKVKQYYKTMG